MLLQFLCGGSQCQGVNARPSLYVSRISSSGNPGHHALDAAHAENFDEYGFEHIFREQLARSAYRTVPGKFLVYVMAQEIKDVQAHGTMIDKFTVADDVLQRAHKA